jgi:hypothetical protein
MDGTIDTRVQTILILLRVFVVQMCLRSRWLATKGGILFKEPLPGNDRKDTHAETQTDGKYLLSMQLRWVQVPLYTYQVL